MKFAGIKVVLFDLDGTLLDTAPDLAYAADQMRVIRGMPSLPLECYRPMVGSGASGMIQAAFSHTPDHPEFANLRLEFFDRYEACMTRRTRPFAEVADMLSALEGAGLAWGVVTNKIERFALPLTAAMPLFAGSATVVGGDTTPHPKPHPAPLLEAARRLAVPPQHCLYVGDDHRDILAGKAAGMPTVAALYGYLGANVDVADWNADAIIETPRALLNFLDLA